MKKEKEKKITKEKRKGEGGKGKVNNKKKKKKDALSSRLSVIGCFPLCKARVIRQGLLMNYA